MNKSILKSYAPAARLECIQVVSDRAKALGLSDEYIEPVETKGDFAIIAGRPFPKEVADRRKRLEELIRVKGFSQVMEEVAYTWFNRLCAIRYMELRLSGTRLPGFEQSQRIGYPRNSRKGHQC